MTSQSTDDSSSQTGQNILLVAILAVLAYIVMDIFGFIPGMKKKGKKKQRGGCKDLPMKIGLSIAVVTIVVLGILL